MNEFISPHQNININISYNLGQQQKIPRVVFGKKITRIVKPNTKEQSDLLYKAFKKNMDSGVQVDELKKGTHSKSNNKKKKSSNVLMAAETEFIVPRRLKTEGNIPGSLTKKEPKSQSKPFFKQAAQHSKSTTNPPQPPTKPPKKLPASSSKARKQQRRLFNKSCMLYPTKKNLLLSDIEHIVSTTTTGPTPTHKHPKKRVNSVTLMRSDKIITRLLDMSVLVSELGGSIPVCEAAERGEVTLRKLRNLHQCMNSVDLRVIKSMERDYGRGVGQEAEGVHLLTYLTKIRHIPLQVLNQKAAKIQQFWRRKTSLSIVPYYSHLFFRNPVINSRMPLDDNLDQISDIVDNGQEVDGEGSFRPSETAPRVSIPRVEVYELGSHDRGTSDRGDDEEQVQEGSEHEGQDEGIEDSHGSMQEMGQLQNQQQQSQDQHSSHNQSQHSQPQQPEQQVDSNSKSLNIQKYKQLVRQSIIKSGQSRKPHPQPPAQPQQDSLQPSPPQQAIAQQSAHWNHVHNILSTNMNKKVPLMSKTVLQQLMKQSAYNKQWVEGEFSNSESRKMSEKSSPREGRLQGVGEAGESEGEEPVERPEYNWNKYSDISRLKKAQQVASMPKNNMPGLLPSGIKPHLFPHHIEQQSQQSNSKQLPQHRNQQVDSIDDLQFQMEIDKDSKWIREQMAMENGIVEKYLDTGLDNFGLRLNHDQKAQTAEQGNHKHHYTVEPEEEEERQQRQGQEREEHRAALEKHRHCEANKQAKKSPNSSRKAEQADIFSSQQNLADTQEPQDKELVYVFNQNDRKQRDITIDYAAKNNKRKDNQQQLGYRQEEMNDFNQFVDVDVQMNKKSGRRASSAEEGQEDEEYLLGNIGKKYRQSAAGQKQAQERQQLAEKIPLFEPTFKDEINPMDLFTNQSAVEQQLRNKKVQKITETIIAKLIEDFATDVSVILRKSQINNTGLLAQQPSRQARKMQSKVANNSLSTSNPGLAGIQTSFQNIREFITKLKDYILGSDEHSKKVIDNLKNNIGPSSMEILSYLRIEEPNQFGQLPEDEQKDQEENEQWLFVIPNDLFQIFNKVLLDQQQKSQGKKLPNRLKLYTEFWHRSIFECYNQCLDFQRPFGITGAPYAWIIEPKLPHSIHYSKQKVKQVLDNAQGRLLQLSCSSSGIIFDKPDSPYRQFPLSEQDKVQLNEQKISRMLANQILDDEYNWITYNDELTELMVDISRKIEELLLFQLSTDIKKIMRRRKMMVQLGGAGPDEEQCVVFGVEDLV